MGRGKGSQRGSKEVAAEEAEVAEVAMGKAMAAAVALVAAQNKVGKIVFIWIFFFPVTHHKTLEIR